MPRYAGFLPRFAAGLVDLLTLIPLMALTEWAYGHSYATALLLEIPLALAFASYNIYFIGHGGQTPGKMALRIKVISVDGTDAGFHRALMRHLVDLIFSLITSALSIYAFISFTASEYDVLPFAEKMELINKHTPLLAETVVTLTFLWIASELVVLFFNAKRRAIHDFIAGTVVVHLGEKSDAV